MRHLLILFLLLLPVLGYTQSSKKEAISYYRQLHQVKVGDVRNGDYLNFAKEYPTDKFVQYYLEEGKKVDDKKYGQLSVEQLYEDPLFIYIGRTNSYGFIDLIKVKRDDISESFIELDGQEISKRFFHEVIPEKDKSHVKRHLGMVHILSSSNFKYKYFKDAEELEIKCHLRIRYDLRTIINKEYVARYSIANKQFIEKNTVKISKK